MLFSGVWQWLKNNFALLSILFLAVFLRFKNLNYNSPFVDEASYITIGRVGLFKGDWNAFTPQNWIGGAFFIYPLLSATASIFGGIYAARFFNAILGLILVILVYLICQKLNFFADEKLNKRVSLLATLFVALSPMALILSRLATLDLLSFVFLALSLFFLLHYFSTQDKKFSFLSSIAFALSFLTKYTTLSFLPLFLILFYLRRRDIRLREVIFYCLPFLTIFIIYFGGNFQSLKIFWAEQVILEKASFGDIFSHFLQSLNIEYPLSTIALVFVLLFLKKKLIFSFFLYLLPLLVFLPHQITGRVSALDKHLLLATFPLFLLIAIVLTFFIQKWPKPGILAATILFSLFFFYSRAKVTSFEKSWPNATEAMSFLQEKISENSKILAQEGSASLYLWGKIDPRELLTIYDINYQGKTGDEGYLQATSGGYFDFIQLDDFSENTRERQEKIRGVITESYSLIYNKDHFQIYQKRV